MNNRATWLIFSFIFLAALFVLSCNNSVEDMLDDYNKQFTWTYVTVSETKEVNEEEMLSPGDEGFDPDDMLREVYPVQYDSTLNLAGPPKNIYSYTWTVYDPKNDYKEVAVNTINGTLNDCKFIIYIPDSLLEADHTYQLTLRIVTQGGVFYKDSASLVIYPHYTYD
ncbi:hypothetical protein [Treponema sp.]|uniref:hypothetical protein n=1 Tax=Treponema sp. TaxID=166 RepID=UPI00388E3FEB